MYMFIIYFHDFHGGFQRIVPGHIPVWEDMLWSLGRGDAFMYKDGRDGLNKKRKCHEDTMKYHGNS